MNVPILFIVFNRPDTTLKVFEIIKQIKPVKLYVSADGSRTEVPGEYEKSQLVRQIVSNIDWPCELKTQFHQHNLGCGLGPRSAFEWFFKHEENGIILEDDCLPDLSFFSFCEELLIKYESNKKILNISGCNLGYEHNGQNESYFFSRYMNMWGWATWRDRMESIDFEMHDWKTSHFRKIKAIKLLKHQWFEWDLPYYKKWYYYWNKTVNANPTWWDFQFIYSQLKSKRYSIFPAKNLIKNLGFDQQGTHTLNDQNPLADLKILELDFPLKHPVKIKPNALFEKNYIKKIWFWH